jgi:hypothetical protein
VTGLGLEHPQQNSSEAADPEEGGAESGAPAARTAISDPALAALIDAWPDLPQPVRRGILAMVEAAKGEGA